MNILITQRQMKNRHGDWTDCLEHGYSVYLERFGLNLFPVSNVTGRLDEIVSAVNPSGIVLSGGGDVDPGLYGGQACEIGSVITSARDQCESKLLEIAIKRNIPVLGICRGMQFINVFFGGKLVADIKNIDTIGEHGVPCKHNIRITDNAVSKELGKDEFLVNSYHNQGILSKELGEDLKAFAIYERLELIEAFHHMRYPIVGIMWHPERPGSPEILDGMLLKSFITRNYYWTDRS
jgi:N5-(cytidine 5'-diphosphoramidyl)-L-glutamine hydrolase